MDISVILQELYPGSSWVIADNNYETLQWNSDTPKPTKKSLEDAWPNVQQIIRKREIESARQIAYRDEADPLFFKYQAGEATQQEWQEARQAVRDRYPYPEATV